MPTWCHMFNATLLESAWLWLDELPPENIDSFKELRKKFLAHYLQQKRYTKDPVELHHVKKKEEEFTEAFMERFTSKSLMFKGAPVLMRISGFMHEITHPGLIKRLNDNIPKIVNEMMSVTKAFIHGEKAAGNSQVKDNKIDLLVQKYEQFMIPEEESIDNGFARFNTIITSLKALNEGFSNKNYVRKFLRALHPKWRAKVTAIEESKDLT
ncbi:reverse transcriptase domain-containing protein [Tanacetum coccineum]